MRPITRTETLIARGYDHGFTAYSDADNRTRRALVRDARRAQLNTRRAHGFTTTAPVLTAPDSQPKLGKSATPSYGLMLIPSDGMKPHGVRGVNLCPQASRGCRAACLSTAGKGAMPDVQRARAARTAFLITNPYATAVLIAHELHNAIRKHGRIMFRPNTVSDIRWELVAPAMLAWIGETNGITAYDYTAWSPDDRAARPAHYKLTYSHKDGRSVDNAAAMVAAGANIAMVTNVRRGQPLPATFLGLPVIDGDQSDDRTRDPNGAWVMLRAKGQAIGDTSGFVVPVA